MLVTRPGAEAPGRPWVPGPGRVPALTLPGATGCGSKSCSLLPQRRSCKGMKFQTNMISRLPPDDLDHFPREYAAQLSFARSQFPRPRTLPWWFRSIHRGPVPYHSIPCHTIPYLDMPCHTIPYRTIPICNLLQTMPCHAISRYTSPYIAMPCRAMPCLCHALPTCWKSASISSLSLTSGRSPPGATFLKLYHADPGTKGVAHGLHIYIYIPVSISPTLGLDARGRLQSARAPDVSTCNATITRGGNMLLELNF